MHDRFFFCDQKYNKLYFTEHGAFVGLKMALLKCFVLVCFL